MYLNSLGASRARKKIRSALLISMIAIAFLIVRCGSNIFEEFSSQDSQEAILQQAKQQLNNKNYSGAIESCALITGSLASSDEVRFICGSAYAGSCGYELVKVINQLKNFSGSPLLLEYLMAEYTGATVTQANHCSISLDHIRSAGPAPQRSTDFNFFAIFSGLTHIGVLLNLYADTNNDDTPDPGFDACNPADLSDARAAQMGRAFWELYRSVENVSTTMTALSDLKTALDGLSAAISLGWPSYNFLLASVNPASFTANQIKGVRTLIQEGTVLGLDYCTDFGDCLCP